MKESPVPSNFVRVPHPNRYLLAIIAAAFALKPVTYAYLGARLTGSLPVAIAATMLALFPFVTGTVLLFLPRFQVRDGELRYNYGLFPARNPLTTLRFKSIPIDQIKAVHVTDEAASSRFQLSDEGQLRRYMRIELEDGRINGPIISDAIKRSDLFKETNINRLAHEFVAHVANTKVLDVKTPQSRDEIIEQHSRARRDKNLELAIAIPAVALCAVILLILANGTRY